jgi:dTMP kinase
VPLFITFEGIEGSGKSTHLRHLVAHLRGAGREVVETREPGGTAAGQIIRRLLLGPETVPLEPLAELMLYCADRAQHIAEVIRPAIAAGRTVVCDRFSDSTIAYQGYARGLDLGAVRALDAAARQDVAPGLTFLLDCPVEEGLRRARGREGSGDRFEREALAFHERVRTGFHALATAAPWRFCVLDTTQPAERVRAQVIAETEHRLGSKPS